VNLKAKTAAGNGSARIFAYGCQQTGQSQKLKIKQGIRQLRPGALDPYPMEDTMDYKNAGVDIEAGYKSVELMKKYVKETMRPEVLGGLGGFSGAFSLDSFKGMEKPTLVSGTDGVGTKLKLAFLLDKHDTVGIDCVAMCVNDIACAGGEPLFFLDYIACGKNYPEKIATIVKGVADGCKQAGAALIGGETAEMPGFYPEDEYDLAGFAVGIVDEKKLITGEQLKAGDVLIGMASSGVHSNGFSLVRKVFEMTKESLETYYEELGTTLGEALIAPTKIYVKALKAVKDAGVEIKACSHITGGGFYENIPRMLPDGVRAVVRKDSYEVPAIFRLLADKGNIEEQMMYNTYNMGIGMVLAVDPSEVEAAMAAVREAGETPYVIGEVEAGEKGVVLC
jgi:phosphoribosylformylglycinamidine cyclo-ligase